MKPFDCPALDIPSWASPSITRWRKTLRVPKSITNGQMMFMLQDLGSRPAPTAAPQDEFITEEIRKAIAAGSFTPAPRTEGGPPQPPTKA